MEISRACILPTRNIEGQICCWAVGTYRHVSWSYHYVSWLNEQVCHNSVNASRFNLSKCLYPKKCDDSLLNLFNIIQHQAIVWVIMFQDVAWVMGRSVLIWIIWQIHRAVVSFAEKNASRLMPRVNHHVQKKGFGLSDRHGGPNCLFFFKDQKQVLTSMLPWAVHGKVIAQLTKIPPCLAPKLHQSHALLADGARWASSSCKP